MPRLMNDDASQTFKMAGNFTFQGAKVDRLGATEYTLATIAVDETGSVDGFQAGLRQALITAVDSCKKSPRSDNLLLRVITFSDKYPRGVNEIHGFKPLADIDPQAYPQLQPGGCTPLCDAAYSALAAANTYGDQLKQGDFAANGIIFIITDGDDNASVATTSKVKAEAERSVKGEILESMISILIGINATQYATQLANFQQEVGMTQFIDAGAATPQKLAKLGKFVSQSISSQSQALGTGGPSQNIAPLI